MEQTKRESMAANKSELGHSLCYLPTVPGCLRSLSDLPRIGSTERPAAHTAGLAQQGTIVRLCPGSAGVAQGLAKALRAVACVLCSSGCSQRAIPSGSQLLRGGQGRRR